MVLLFSRSFTITACTHCAVETPPLAVAAASACLSASHLIRAEIESLAVEQSPSHGQRQQKKVEEKTEKGV